jgi:hypothetical protein
MRCMTFFVYNHYLLLLHNFQLRLKVKSETLLKT